MHVKSELYVGVEFGQIGSDSIDFPPGRAVLGLFHFSLYGPSGNVNCKNKNRPGPEFTDLLLTV